jgi:DNA-binding NarL/FixJ family response regulator
MKRVPFVDDEARRLEQLRQMLESRKDQRDMAFAPGGEAALTLLDATPFDVVVSDISMPGMDGAAWMKTVCERYPAIVRIVLSGPQEMEAALRAVPVAHQFLLKPCDPDMLRVAVERAMSLSNILSNNLLANLVGSVKDLPVLPRTYLALKQKLAEPDASIDDVVRIVEQDASARVRGVAVVAGLLHDVGKLVPATRAPAHFKRALEETEAEGSPLYAVQTDLMGVSHAEVGAYLLGI